MKTDKEALLFHDLKKEKGNYDFESIISKDRSGIELQNPKNASHEDAETVCGPDNRIKVTNTRVMPYQAICKLYMRTTTSKNYIGSGFLTHANKVVTAGHCVYDHDEGGWMDSVIVVPAKNGTSEPYGRFNASRVAAVKAWTEDQSVRYDMGVIKLDSNVSHSGRIRLNLTDSDRGKVCGYPGDRDRGIFQYHMTDTLRSSNGRFYYNIDTYGGQSGCPLLKNSTTAIGIHNYGGCPNKSSDLYQKFLDQVDAF